MAGDDDKSYDDKSGADVVAFPHSRVPPVGTTGEFKNLGMGRMARTLGVAKEQQSGHWCNRCKGIWFGYLLEVECPECGNRHG